MYTDHTPTGRFAPSPTGRMHMGNVFTALTAWLSARSAGGRFILRIEDLDTGRSRHEYALQTEDDLRWLGLDWDEGGTDDRGPNGPYSQSRRSDLYAAALERLCRRGLVYPCRCTRAGLHAAGAPHASDGRTVYRGTCRPAPEPPYPSGVVADAHLRLWTPRGAITVNDLVQGARAFDLAQECGDFVLRRADGAYAYQLAVVVDDAAMGVDEVVRGADLLESAARQIYLYGLLGLKAPAFAHVPLLCNEAGARLSKRDGAMSMEQIRARYRPEELIGRLAFAAGLIPSYRPLTPDQLLPDFDWSRIRACGSVRIDSSTLLPVGGVNI